MKKQKKSLTSILASAPVLLPLIVSAQTTSGGWSKSNYTGTGLPYQASLADIVANIAYWLLGVFGFIAIIGFVISGIMYLVAAGDEDAQERAKRAMMYSITGVIVGLVGLVVIYAVEYFLGGGDGTAITGL